MKKQLLFLTLSINLFLGAMDAPTIEDPNGKAKDQQKEIVRESKVPSLRNICVDVIANALQTKQAKKEFLENPNFCKSINVPFEVGKLVAYKILSTHPVICFLLSNMQFNLLEQSDDGQVWLPKEQHVQFSHGKRWCSRDGQHLLEYDYFKDENLVFLSDKTGKNICELKTGMPVQDIALNPDCSRVLFVDYLQLQIWDLKTKSKVFELRSSYFAKPEWSQDGKKIKIWSEVDRFINVEKLFAIEEALKRQDSHGEQNGNPIAKALLLVCAYDTKQNANIIRNLVTNTGLNISSNPSLQAIFQSLDPQVQEVLFKNKYIISNKEQTDSKCLIN